MFTGQCALCQAYALKNAAAAKGVLRCLYSGGGEREERARFFVILVTMPWHSVNVPALTILNLFLGRKWLHCFKAYTVVFSLFLSLKFDVRRRVRRLPHDKAICGSFCNRDASNGGPGPGVLTHIRRGVVWGRHQPAVTSRSKAGESNFKKGKT